MPPDDSLLLVVMDRRATDDNDDVMPTGRRPTMLVAWEATKRRVVMEAIIFNIIVVSHV